MRPLLAALSLRFAAVAVAMSGPALASHPQRSQLDDGQPIHADWTATQSFDAVTLSGSDDVFVARGENWRIRATGRPELLAELRFVVEDGDLVIGRRTTDRAIPGTARIEVTAPAVEGATLAGSGSLAIDEMRGTKIGTTLAGSGMIEVGRVEARELAATVAGSGDLRLAGRAGESRISIAGSGNLDATELRVGNARVSVAGSGDAAFHADGSVSASIIGSGEVAVTGTTDCSQSRMGSGRLRCSR